MFNLKAVYGVFFMNFSLKDAPNKLRTDIVLADMLKAVPKVVLKQCWI